MSNSSSNFNSPFTSRDDVKLEDATHAITKFSVRMAMCNSVTEFPIQTHLIANGFSVYSYDIEDPHSPPYDRVNRSLHKRIIEDFRKYVISQLEQLRPDATFIYDGSVSVHVVENDVIIAILYGAQAITGIKLDLDLTEFNDRMKELAPPKPITINQWMERKGMGGMELGPERVDISNSVNWAKDCFYPQLANGIKSTVNDFMASTNNMWLFYGLPGTGKSTLARQICKLVADGAEVTTQTEGITTRGMAAAPRDWGPLGNDSPRPRNTYSKESSILPREVHVINSSFIIKTPDFISSFNNVPDNSIVIVEDADVLMGKRSEGNAFMSTLLNKLDGIVRSDIKIIFSCNLTTLKGVDEALLRPGRLFEATYFGKLPEEQTKLIQKEVPAVKRTGPGMVLAELFEKPKTSGRVGFVE